MSWPSWPICETGVSSRTRNSRSARLSFWGNEITGRAITESDHARRSSCRSSPSESGDVVAPGRVAPCWTSLDGS